MLLATCRELGQVLGLDHCGAAGMCGDVAGLLGQRETGDTLPPCSLFLALASPSRADTALGAEHQGVIWALQPQVAPQIPVIGT